MGLEQINFNQDLPGHEQKESIKSEKQIAWEKKLEEVNKITDALGLGIDDKIKEPVAAFLIHDFATVQSCEGHLAGDVENGHGQPYPWIEIEVPEPENWEDADKKREWKMDNLKQQQKLMSFLEDFYQDRETPFDARLTFRGLGGFGAFYVQSFGANLTELRNPDEQKEKLDLYRKEMFDFTEFLKDKYFEKE